MDKFNPEDHLVNLKGGKQYLPAHWRVFWFRSEHPDWGIVTRALKIEDDHAIFRCTIRNENGDVMATATKKEDKAGFADFLEKAETGAISRALALCGYGTQFTEGFEEEGEKGVGSATYTCSYHTCGIALTPAQHQFSMKTYGKALCPTHQDMTKKEKTK